MSSEERTTYPRALVLDVLLELGHYLDPVPAWQRSHALCERVCGVGGYRRGKAAMKDLELLYVPRRREVEDAQDMFGARLVIDVTERRIDELRGLGVLAPRLNKDGKPSWGPWNKHAVHVATGLPIDLFAATAENYCNRLVVTTGPAESNVRIAAAARKLGWEWEVYDAGFVPLGGTWEKCPRERRTMRSEREVFEFVGMEWLPPEDRR